MHEPNRFEARGEHTQMFKSVYFGRRNACGQTIYLFASVKCVLARCYLNVAQTAHPMAYDVNDFVTAAAAPIGEPTSGHRGAECKLI